MTSTGLLTARCDPYGAESAIKLFGGVFPESMKGNYNWYCPERAEARFRLVCTGGEYGMGYRCEGGHRGPPMPLCRKHQRELGTRGETKPRPLKSAQYDGDGHEQHWAPGSQVGGTKANETCPACAMPPLARELNDKAGYLSGEIGRFMMMGLELSKPAIALRQQLEVVRVRLDELNLTGQVHKCPLRLVEVS